MVSLAMLAILVGCAVGLYLKGTLVQGLTMIFNALFAGFVAFAFFETLAALLTKYSAGMAAWAQMICFLLLFVLVLAILQTITAQLGKEKIDLGMWPERVGRIVCGILLGYVITGHLLVAATMAPLPNKYPYARLDDRNPDPSKPNKPLFSPDGFVSGLFGTVSKGSFASLSKPQSFAVLHADYLNQLYLNRHKPPQSVPVMTDKPALNVPRQAGIWEAPATLRDTEGQALPARGGENLMLVRVGINKSALKDASKFTLSQLRLICIPKGNTDNPLAGQGQAVYPIGYMGPGGRLERKSLGDLITIQSSDVPKNVRNIDFAFYVPTHLSPSLIGFKLNNLEKVSAPVSGEDIPQPDPFGATASPTENRPEPDTSAAEPRPDARRPSSDEGRRGSGLSPIGQTLTGGALEDN